MSETIENRFNKVFGNRIELTKEFKDDLIKGLLLLKEETVKNTYADNPDDRVVAEEHLKRIISEIKELEEMK